MSQALLDTIAKLPPYLQEELLHYAEFLSHRLETVSPPTDEPKKKYRSMEKPAGIFVLPLPDDFDKPLDDFKN
jgi:hypothetical protein